MPNVSTKLQVCTDDVPIVSVPLMSTCATRKYAEYQRFQTVPIWLRYHATLVHSPSATGYYTPACRTKTCPQSQSTCSGFASTAIRTATSAHDTIDKHVQRHSVSSHFSQYRSLPMAPGTPASSADWGIPTHEYQYASYRTRCREYCA